MKARLNDQDVCHSYTMQKIVLFSYGQIHPRRILNFFFWHEDTSAEYPTRISMKRITEFLNAAAVLT